MNSIASRLQGWTAIGACKSLRRAVCSGVIVLACLLGGSAAAVGAEPVSFRNDVMAVLSKCGCNQGACHGNQNGKNGFKLSLRGEDPEFDFGALRQGMFGRRVNALHPGESLLLLKATGVVSHEGGKRFEPGSPEYRMLFQWIAQGLQRDPRDQATMLRLIVSPTEQVLFEPDDRVQLRVQAQFSDGQLRDVTRLAVYEPSSVNVTISSEGEVRREQSGETTVLVRYLDCQATVQLAFLPARPEYRPKHIPPLNPIDAHVFAKLARLRIEPSGPCSDSVFLRRAYLDTLGVLPTPEEARAFLSDTSQDKRERLIDALLQRDEFASFWALKWSDLLHNEEKALDRKGVQAFHDWIRRSLAQHMPLNEFARELIAARGSSYGEPASNYYRALRDPMTRAETTAQVFLGIRLQCARCHNHPFDRWTQNDYYALTAFFARVQYRIVENNRRDNLDKHEFVGEQVIWQDRESEMHHPRTGAVMAPRFLGESTPALPPSGDRLQALADWVARPDNPYFARAQVNRVWFHLMGRGIVDPNDDFRSSNPPGNGPLLDALAEYFVAQQFDLRALVGTIMKSQTYQLASRPNASNREEESNFSHSLVRPLQAEVLADALARVLESPVRFNGYPLGTFACQLPGVKPTSQRGQRPSQGERFLVSFGKPERSLSCECERSEDATLSQAFQLISGELLNQMLSHRTNRLGRLIDADQSNREIVEEFYLAALSRLPAEAERKAILARIDRAIDRRSSLEDLVWAIVNSKEFLLRQ